MDHPDLLHQIANDLGYVRAKVEGIEAGVVANGARIDGLDGRLRAVETRSTVNGAVSGGVMGLAAATVAAFVSAKLGL